jgi:putative NADH-flavin reductase
MSDTKKKVIVFGATGELGQEIIRFSFKLGYTVTAFLRNVEKLPTDLKEKVENNTLRIVKVQRIILKFRKICREMLSNQLMLSPHLRDKKLLFIALVVV